MAITGTTDLGNEKLLVTVNHDPSAEATDCPRGSIIVEDKDAPNDGRMWRKLDDGSSTNVVIMATQEPIDASERTGFVDRDDVSISFDNGLRRLTVQPAVSTFEYYIAGIKYTVSSADTVDITDTEGLWYCYYDGDTLTASQAIPAGWYWGVAPVAIVYWDATNNAQIYLGTEAHGMRMSGNTHKWAHESIGTTYESGLSPTDLVTEAAGDTDSHAQVGIGAGEIHDEDLEFDISAITNTANKYVYYKDGAAGNWRLSSMTAFPVISFSGGSNRLAYNQFTGGAWQQTEVGNNQFVLAHCFANNDESRDGVFFVQGENVYTTIPAAREGATTELSTLTTAGLPFAEAKSLFTLIFQTSDGYTNTVKARTRKIETGGADYVDWRTNVVGGSGATAIIHNNTSSRDATDAHPGAAVSLDASGFSGNLSGTDTDVQTAMGTLDAMSAGGWDFTSNETRYIDPAGGGGGTGDGTAGDEWLSWVEAATWLASKSVAPGVVLNVESADGGTTEASSYTWNHPQAAQIFFVGENTYDISSSSVVSYAGAAGAWAVNLGVSDSSNAAVGDIVGNFDTAYTTANHEDYLAGAFELTSVDSGGANRIGFNSTHEDSLTASSTSATVRIFKSVFEWSGTDGIIVSPGRILNIDSVGLLGASGGDAITLLGDAQCRVATSIAVVGFDSHVMAEEGGSFVGGGLLVGGSGSASISASHQSLVKAHPLAVNGSQANGVLSSYGGEVDGYGATYPPVATGCASHNIYGTWYARIMWLNGYTTGAAGVSSDGARILYRSDFRIGAGFVQYNEDEGIECNDYAYTEAIGATINNNGTNTVAVRGGVIQT